MNLLTFLSLFGLLLPECESKLAPEELKKKKGKSVLLGEAVKALAQERWKSLDHSPATERDVK